MGKLDEKSILNLLKEVLGTVKNAELYAARIASRSVELDIGDVWYDDSLAVSFVLVMVNGADFDNEVRIVKDCLFWKEFYGKDTVRLRCLQGTDHVMFNFCLKRFNVTDFPTLVISDSPTFDDFVLVGSSTLLKMFGGSANSIGFLQKLHHMVMGGGGLSEVKRYVDSPDFWKINRRQIDDIRSLVYGGKIREAIERLLKLKHVIEDPGLCGKITLISSSYRAIENGQVGGTLNYEEEMRQRNKILSRLLMFVDGVDRA